MSGAVEKSERILLADYPKLPLPETIVSKLHNDSLDWAHANGLVMRTKEDRDKSDICMNAPLALLPSPFPRELFDQAVKVQNGIAELYMRLAHATEFLVECHQNVVKTDEFTRRLLDILTTVVKEGLAQKFTLAIQRSDYMCHKDPFTKDFFLRQVEVNNIASSMGAHAERLTKWHRRVLRELGYSEKEIKLSIPDNEPIALIATALLKAREAYGNPDSLIVVVVEDVNQNQIDQRHVEFELENQGVSPANIVRLTLTQCHQQLKLSPERELMLDATPVSVVYFRAGYSPDHYHSESEWDARLTIERSRAVKSPWIGLQVANTKKVQQVLAADGILERFCSNPRVAASIRSTFAGLWSLDSDDVHTNRIIKDAKEHPERYVLKPQLEGGAGNYYGEVVREKLLRLSSDELAAHILMERIFPDHVQNYMVRANQPLEIMDCVGELGVYGYAYGYQDEEITAVTGGHILRTKGKHVDEGGVAVGAAVIDSPFLYDFI